MDHLGIINLLGGSLVKIGNLITKGIHKWLRLAIIGCHSNQHRGQVAVDPRLACLFDCWVLVQFEDDITLNPQVGTDRITSFPFSR